MKFPSIKPTARIVITTGAIVGGIIILILTMVLPSFDGIRLLASSIAVEHARIEPLLARGIEYRKTLQQVEAIKKDLPRVSALLLNKDEAIALFAKLKETSNALQLIETTRIGDALLSGEVTELPIELELRGTYLHVLQYIQYLESSPVLIAIKRIDMRAGQGSNNASFIATINAAVYTNNQ